MAGLASLMALYYGLAAYFALGVKIWPWGVGCGLPLLSPVSTTLRPY